MKERNKYKFSDEIHWRETIVSKILPKEDLEKRWKKINYKPKNVQLRIF